MDYGKLLENIGDVAPEYADYANKLGLESLISLCDNYGGTCVYVPMTYNLARQAIKKGMAKDYASGVNVETIALKYGVARATAYSLLSEEIKQAKKKPKAAR